MVDSARVQFAFTRRKTVQFEKGVVDARWTTKKYTEKFPGIAVLFLLALNALDCDMCGTNFGLLLY